MNKNEKVKISQLEIRVQDLTKEISDFKEEVREDIKDLQEDTKVILTNHLPHIRQEIIKLGAATDENKYKIATLVGFLAFLGTILAERFLDKVF